MPTIKRGDDSQHLARLAEEYDKAKKFADAAQKRADALKKELSEIVDAQGVVDHSGHRWLKVGAYNLKRERRVSKSLDTKAAETWAKEEGVWDQVSRVVEVLEEDDLLTLSWERRDLADAIAKLYAEREVWAFRLLENKDEED
jgi:hypothetical protein